MLLALSGPGQLHIECVLPLLIFPKNSAKPFLRILRDMWSKVSRQQQNTFRISEHLGGNLNSATSVTTILNQVRVIVVGIWH